MKKRIYWTILSLWITLPLSAQQESESYDVQVLQTAIGRAMDEFDYELVIEKIPVDTQDSLLLTYRAKALMAMNRYKEAVLIWEMLNRPPLNVQTLVHIGDCYRTMGNYMQAAEAYRQAIELKPDNKYFRSLHIRSLLYATDYRKAVEASHDWLDRDSTSAEGFKFLGMAYEGLEDATNAFFAYNKAYRLDSLDQQTVALVASIFNNNSQFQDAIDVTETYRSTDTTGMDVNRQNAKAYCMLREYKTAVKRYESLKASGDRSFTTYYYLGISHYGDNWYYGAYENLKEAHRLSPNDINVLYYYGLAASYTSWKKEGAELLAKAVKLAVPTDSLMLKLYDASAGCYARAGLPEESIDMLHHLHRLTNNYVVYFRIAQQYDAMKNYKQAAVYYEKYMAAVPENKRMVRKEDGSVAEDAMTNYQWVERRIREIREEQFFKEGFPEGNQK